MGFGVINSQGYISGFSAIQVYDVHGRLKVMGGGSPPPAPVVWGSITGLVTNQTDLITYLSGNYYPLSSNPAGYLTQTAADLLYYPLSSNPAGYITSAALIGYVPTTRTLTINGTSYDLSADRSWTIAAGGTVTSVGLTVPSAFSVTPGSITTSGTFVITGAGTISQYIDGTGALQTFPTIPAQYNPTAGTGISITGAYPNQTITNTLPDQTVVLTAGTGISTSGTYPNFTITNTSPSLGGTVTSVQLAAGTGISLSGTNPITTSGTITVTNSAPDQTVVLTGGTGISTSGTYPSFTITNTSPDQTVSLSTTGTGLAVTGTYPSFTLENTLPDQTVAISAGTGISVSGTYPSFTITNTSTGGGGGLEYGIAAGTNTYTVTIAGVTGYVDGDTYAIKFTNGNDDDSTININGLGAVTMVKQSTIQVTGGDIKAGQELILIYDGTNFQCIGVAPNQLFAFVTNDDSVTITKGQPVYAFGAAGNRMSVKLAYNTSDATSAQTVGLVFSTSIAAGQRGFIITQGVISGVNTGAYSPGDTLYLGATAGTLTSTKPFAPNHLVYIGTVERANAGNGQIYVRPQNGYEMNEIHDVQSNGAVNKDILYRDTTVTPNLWKPASIDTILGYTPVPTTRTLTINGTGYDLSADRSWTIAAGGSSATIGTTIDGSGGTITVGQKGYVQIPYACTINSWRIIANASGSIVIDVWKAAAPTIPTVANTITGSALPTLSTQQTNASSTLTGWTTSVAANDIIGFNVNSATTVSWVILQLLVTKI